VTVADLVDALGPRSFGPLLLVPSLILITPLSGIPGAPTFGAIVIVLVAGQMLFGAARVWLPGFVRERALGKERIAGAVRRMKPVARFVDRLVSRRFEFMTQPPFSILPALLVIVLALAMPPLEFVPMSSTILAAVIFVLALALTAQDGLLALIALAVTAIAIGMTVTLAL
jgi:hypothetical protein